MTVSSRTPEGLPSRCPLCGAETNLEFSDPGDDAPCPNCGHLLWESTKVFSSFQRLVGEQLGISPDAVSADRSFANDLGADSLDTVELVMELEEEFDVNMPEDAAEQIQTVRDAIRYILEQRRLKEIANQDCLPESGGDKLQVRSTSHRHREIMTLSPLPLSYCTNVHPGTTIAEVEAGLQKYTVPAKEKFGSPLAAGLWLAAPIMREFAAAPDAVAAFAERLAKMGLPCYTLNAFPYGDFHSPRVKENVYIPDWTRGERLDYTVSCAQVLAALLPPNVQGSISTVPLGFKNLVAAQYRQTEEFIDLCVPRLIELARRLRTLEDATDKLIRLAIEPEPLCVLETTDETLAFFRQLWMAAARLGEEENVRRYLGLCYDVCHQAVEFEDVGTSIAAIDAAGLRINKLHISCAIHLDNPRDEEARRELARYVEPRYLHQTMALAADGRVLRELDLSPELIERPSAEYLAAEAWRVHFHVPVNAETLGPLRTTRPELKQALAAVAKLPYAPHLEVETYTWRVMPGMTVDLADVLAKELSATRELLQPLG